MSQRPRLSSLALPLVVITALLNIPGMAGEGMHARLVFVLVGALTWSAAEIYDRRADIIVGTVCDTVIYALTAFFAESMKRTRVCISATITGCTAYSITAGDYWVNPPPFPLAPLFIVGVVWAFLELLHLTIDALSAWSSRQRQERPCQQSERSDY